MSIEKLFERQAAALEQIASTLSVMAELLGQADSPQGEPAAQLEPVATQVAVESQVVNLTANPVAPQQAQPNNVESLQPAAGVTKRTLWDALQDTYNTLAAVNRGPEIGELLAKYQAMHIDQLDPAHYVAVHRGLLDLKASAGSA